MIARVGTGSLATRAVELGCLFSLNGHEALSPKVIELIPVDRVLTETDFPHSRRFDPVADRPGMVTTIEDALVAHHGLTLGELRVRMWSTLSDLFVDVPESLASPELTDAFKLARLS